MNIEIAGMSWKLNSRFWRMAETDDLEQVTFGQRSHAKSRADRQVEHILRDERDIEMCRENTFSPVNNMLDMNRYESLRKDV